MTRDDYRWFNMHSFLVPKETDDLNSLLTRTTYDGDKRGFFIFREDFDPFDIPENSPISMQEIVTLLEIAASLAWPAHIRHPRLIPGNTRISSDSFPCAAQPWTGMGLLTLNNIGRLRLPLKRDGYTIYPTVDDYHNRNSEFFLKTNSTNPYVSISDLLENYMTKGTTNPAYNQSGNEFLYLDQSVIDAGDIGTLSQIQRFSQDGASNTSVLSDFLFPASSTVCLDKALPWIVCYTYESMIHTGFNNNIYDSLPDTDIASTSDKTAHSILEDQECTLSQQLYTPFAGYLDSELVWKGLDVSSYDLRAAKDHVSQGQSQYKMFENDRRWADKIWTWISSHSGLYVSFTEFSLIGETGSTCTMVYLQTSSTTTRNPQDPLPPDYTGSQTITTSKSYSQSEGTEEDMSGTSVIDHLYHLHPRWKLKSKIIHVDTYVDGIWNSATETYEWTQCSPHDFERLSGTAYVSLSNYPDGLSRFIEFLGCTIVIEFYVIAQDYANDGNPVPGSRVEKTVALSFEADDVVVKDQSLSGPPAYYSTYRSYGMNDIVTYGNQCWICYVDTSRGQWTGTRNWMPLGKTDPGELVAEFNLSNLSMDTISSRIMSDAQVSSKDYVEIYKASPLRMYLKVKPKII